MQNIAYAESDNLLDSYNELSSEISIDEGAASMLKTFSDEEYVKQLGGYIAGSQNFNKMSYVVSDYNEDGIVNVYDYLALKFSTIDVVSEQEQAEKETVEETTEQETTTYETNYETTEPTYETTTYETTYETTTYVTTYEVETTEPAYETETTIATTDYVITETSSEPTSTTIETTITYVETTPHNTDTKVNFNFGADSWSFDKQAFYYYKDSSKSTNGGFNDDLPYRNQMNSNYLEAYDNTTYSKVVDGYYTAEGDYVNGSIYGEWKGSCYGMTSLQILYLTGVFDTAENPYNFDCLYNATMPFNCSEISSLITYYQFLQNSFEQMYVADTISDMNMYSKIKMIKQCINNNGYCMLGYSQDNFGAHSVMAYAYYSLQEPTTIDGVEYTNIIYICDPASASTFDRQYCMYYNSDGDWCIPGYNYVSTKYGAKIIRITSDVGVINANGFLDGTVDETDYSDAVIHRGYEYKTENALIDDTDNEGILVDNPVYYNDDISIDYNDSMEGAIERTDGKIQRAHYAQTKDALYRCDTLGTTKGAITPEKNLITASDNDNSFDFMFQMTFDEEEDYYINTNTTQYYTIAVRGSGANSASLQKCSDGYYYLWVDNLDELGTSKNGNMYNLEFHAWSRDKDESNEGITLTYPLNLDAMNSGYYFKFRIEYDGHYLHIDPEYTKELPTETED